MIINGRKIMNIQKTLRRTLAVLVSVLLAWMAVLVWPAVAQTTVSRSWEVRVLGCHGGMTLYRYDHLGGASQREVSEVRRQIHYHGVQYVKLYRVTASGGGPQQFALVSRSTIIC